MNFDNLLEKLQNWMWEPARIIVKLDTLQWGIEVHKDPPYVTQLFVLTDKRLVLKCLAS